MIGNGTTAIFALVGRMLLAATSAFLPLAAMGADEVPRIESASDEVVRGRWDALPVDMQDRFPADAMVDPDRRVWLLTDGGLASYESGRRVEVISRLAEGSSEPDNPSLIGKSMIALPGGQVLVSTIWREVFLVEKGQLTRLSERDVSGGYSFALVDDQTLAVALDASNWLDDELATELEARTGLRVLPLVGYSGLAAKEGRLFGATDMGAVAEIDRRSGEVIWSFRYSAEQVRTSALRIGESSIYIGTTSWYDRGACYRIPIAHPYSAQSFYSGDCYDLLVEGDEIRWASVETGVFRLDGEAWKRYFPSGMGGIGIGGRFASDDAGNLWVASSLGLWRYYDYVHGVALPAAYGDRAVQGMYVSPSRQFYVSLGEDVVIRRKDDEWTSLDLPKNASSNAYYRSPVFATGSDGTVVLTSDGLYREGVSGLERIGPAPVSSQGPAAPAALAICPDGRIYAGYAWLSSIFEFTGGAWQVAHEMAPDVGGSAIPSLSCGDDDTLWAMSTSAVAARSSGGSWIESAAIHTTPNAKRNLYGAIVADTDGTATAWGSWGYPVKATIANGAVVATRMESQNQLGTSTPYVYYRAIAIGERKLVLSDVGLFSSTDEGIRRLPLIDDQYQLFATDFTAIENPGSALGADVILMAGGRLFEIDAPAVVPLLSAPPSRPSDSEYLTLDLDVRSFVGPPELGELKTVVTPQVDHTISGTPTGYRLAIPRAVSGQDYAVVATYLDAAGQSSAPLEAVLRFELPLIRNPLVVAPLGGLGLLVLLWLATNRSVADFIVRRVLGRRWRLGLGTPSRTISLSLKSGELVADIETFGATLRGVDSAADRDEAIEALRAKIVGLSDASPGATGEASLRQFEERLTDIARDLDALVPPLVASELRTHTQRELQLELDRSISDLPWELLSSRNDVPLMVDTPIARTIATDATTSPPAIAGGLTAVVFAAGERDGRNPAWDREQAAVAHALSNAGIAKRLTPSFESPIEDLLSVFTRCDILHLIGHGELDTEQSVGFRTNADTFATTAAIRASLASAGRAPPLVFINACGSVEERRDLGGKVLAGLATPFLEMGSIVVGSFWPVQTLFATELATEFYRRALPAPRSFAFRLLAGRELAGAPFSEALLQARKRLHAQRPATGPTWSAYTLFGNVRARLELA